MSRLWEETINLLVAYVPDSITEVFMWVYYYSAMAEQRSYGILLIMISNHIKRNSEINAGDVYVI